MSQRPRLYVYRWEAVYASDFTLAKLGQQSLALAEILLQQGWSCLIGYDTRFLAAQFARYVFRVLESKGVRVEFCPTPVPFPAMEQALQQRRADSALMLSAGNLPYWYSGLLAMLPAENLPFPVEADTPDPVPTIEFPGPALEETPQTLVNLRTPYLDLIRTMADLELIRRAGLTVFVDPMNGTASGYIPAVLGEGAQTKAVEINKEPDPLFARLPPQPLENGLTRMRKLVRESNSHLGVALSADGRAIGVTSSTGELLSPTDVALLLASYLSQQYRQRGLVVLPASASVEDEQLRSWERATGLRVEVVEHPAARMADLLAQDRNSLLSGTTATGELTLGRYSAVPDALVAALLLIELTARAGGKLQERLRELQQLMGNG